MILDAKYTEYMWDLNKNVNTAIVEAIIWFEQFTVRLKLFNVQYLELIKLIG